MEFISAKEVKDISIANSKTKQALKKLEEQILNAAEEGDCKLYGCIPSIYFASVRDLLEGKGYVVNDLLCEYEDVLAVIKW